MSLRNGVNIHKFEVKICNLRSQEDIEFHMGNWLLKATRCNVGKICLDLESFSTFTLPSAVLNSAFLRDLELLTVSDAWVKFPSASFGGLENLTLREGMVPSEFGDWISSCKSLKMVYLHGVECDEEFSQSLILHAPKLERFSWAGSVSNYSCEGNLEFLCHSDISIEHTSIANNEYKFLDNGIIGKVLQSMHWVSSMSIRDVSIEEISSPELLPEFCNLLSLTLKRTNPLDEITSVVLLLKSMPKLNTLKILGIPCSKEEKISHGAEYWESQSLPFVHSLKEVEMEIEGKNNEIELIKYLLKNARALKKMTILYKAVLCRESAIRKIEEFQIASSRIAFMEKISHGAEYWESQSLPFVHSLKEVEMEIEGKNNEIELIKYLLKNARALKKITILYKAVLCRESAIRKIEEFQIASYHIALYFRPVLFVKTLVRF
ncbi:hypothetical protein FEM48_Zijuj05G0025700 [Ziziphus jujuba var. spinosa]|uniref:FBD domain-containing protein n=1 Tax=Ziziphus jujuba var. spinosa TaxID=714518 RepID=A0A978VCB3_ZIZJJ|nr:hypothetical protein FEM48_Zijuj05G0025700 [Ziziphus jujuba var. spinosa]